MASSVVGKLIYLITGDTAGLHRKLTESERMLRAAGRKMESVGKALTVAVTLPVTAIGTAFVKSAIDAEETASKFNTAFRDVREEADATARSLQENYGLSRVEAQQLLAATGDLLKGFGATGAEALSLSDKVQRLAVDLASYNNLEGGAARASQILTKAMLGERESLTSLGIKIGETEVQARLLAKGQQDLEGRALLLAKAQATLELAMEQSGDAMGDFARTQDSAANQLRILKARFQDAATALGEDLLPLATQLIGWARDAVQWFTALDAEQRKTIITIAAIAASLGPLLVAAGKLTQAVSSLSIAFKVGASAMGIYGLAAAGIAAAVAGLVAWNNRTREARERQDQLLESTRRLVTVTNELQKAQAEAQIKIMTTALGDQNQVVRRYEQSLASAKAELARLEEEMAKASPAAARGLAGSLLAAREQVATFEKKVQDGRTRVAELNAGLRENQKAIDAYTEANRKAAEVTSQQVNPALRERSDLEERFPGQLEEEKEAIDALIRMELGRMAAQEQYAREVEEYNARIKRSYEQTAETIFSTVMPVFESIGAAIVEGASGWEGFKEAATDAIAAILQALAKQWATLAAASWIPGPTFNPAAGVGLALQAAAALVAAGFVKALEAGGDFVTSGPQLLLVGDNPGGREHVTVTPESSPNIAGPQEDMIHLTVNLDGRPIADFVTRATRQRQILVDAGAVT